MALNQHPSSATAVSGSDKGELCTQKENAAIEEKEPNQSNTQVIGSALQVIEQPISISIFVHIQYYYHQNSLKYIIISHFSIFSAHTISNCQSSYCNGAISRDSTQRKAN